MKALGVRVQQEESQGGGGRPSRASLGLPVSCYLSGASSIHSVIVKGHTGCGLGRLNRNATAETAWWSRGWDSVLSLLGPGLRPWSGT